MAQEQPALPAGTLLKSAPKFSQWEIHFSYGSSANSSDEPAPTPDPAAQLPPQEVTVTLTRPLWHAVLLDTMGRKSETWFDGTNAYLILPGTPLPNPVATDATDNLPDYLNYMAKKADFPDMDWISLQNYVGQESIDGVNCLVFKKTGDVEEKAWINADTRLPVRWTKANETRDFTFLQAPSAKLELPDAIKRIAKALEMVRQNNNRMPPRGG
jgi:hypothetical protein